MLTLIDSLASDTGPVQLETVPVSGLEQIYLKKKIDLVDTLLEKVV